jgi:hypothetical protein
MVPLYWLFTYILICPLEPVFVQNIACVAVDDVERVLLVDDVELVLLVDDVELVLLVDDVELVLLVDDVDPLDAPP